METSAKTFLIQFHLLFTFYWLDSSTTLDLSRLFHLINPQVFSLHLIQFKQGPAVVWMLNLQSFFWDSGFSPGACFDAAEGQISILIKKGPVFSAESVQPADFLRDWQGLKFQRAAWTQPVRRDFDQCFVLYKAEGCTLANCSRPRMPVESGGGSLADTLVWPALNHYPAAKQQDNSRRRTEKVTRCAVASCNQPDPLWPLTPPFIQPCQVGGNLFIYICFINLNAGRYISKCVSR